jgi:hypothetical protein
VFHYILCLGHVFFTLALKRIEQSNRRDWTKAKFVHLISVLFLFLLLQHFPQLNLHNSLTKLSSFSQYVPKNSSNCMRFIHGKLCHKTKIRVIFSVAFCFFIIMSEGHLHVVGPDVTFGVWVTLVGGAACFASRSGHEFVLNLNDFIISAPSKNVISLRNRTTFERWTFTAQNNDTTPW